MKSIYLYALFILLLMNFPLFSELTLNQSYLEITLSNPSDSFLQVAQLPDDVSPTEIRKNESTIKNKAPVGPCEGVQITNALLPKIRLKTKGEKSKRIDLGGTTSEELCRTFGTDNPTLKQVLGLHPSALKEYKNRYPFLVGMYGGLTAACVISIIEFTKTANDANEVSKGNISGQRGFEAGPLIAIVITGVITCGSIVMVSHYHNKAISIFNSKQEELNDNSKPGSQSSIIPVPKISVNFIPQTTLGKSRFCLNLSYPIFY